MLVRALCLLLIFVGPYCYAENAQDPWEGFNRKIFAFNDFMDRHIAKPAAKAYQKLTPRAVDQSVTNFFANIDEVLVLVNDVLQWKWREAGTTTGRFLVNSTLGIGGFIDVASHWGWEKSDEDFGQTLGKWGVSSGPYLMLPFFGPSTMRDAATIIPDAYLYPINKADALSGRERWVLTGIRLVDKRADLLAAEKFIIGDRYSFLRDAYLQRKSAEVSDGKVKDDFGNEDF